MTKILPTLSSILLAIGVACGAFGAHGLRGVVPDSDLLIWEKAVFYHLFHGLAALALVLFNSSVVTHERASRVALALIISVTIFSGSLYLLVLTNTRWLGAITPLGGLGFIVSWLYLALKSKP
jgi:uncharacterized membrane protein YgdD (TMEM256/DUF423 family)